MIIFSKTNLYLSGLEAVCLAVCVCGRVFKLFGEVWVAVGVGVGLPQLQYQREAHSRLPLLLESVAAWFWSRLLCPPQSAPLLPVTGQRHRGTALRSAQCCAALQRTGDSGLKVEIIVWCLRLLILRLWKVSCKSFDIRSRSWYIKASKHIKAYSKAAGPGS